MTIKRNSSGRSATVTPTGVTGNRGSVSEGGGTPQNKNPLAQSTRKSSKLPPATVKPMKKR